MNVAQASRSRCIKIRTPIRLQLRWAAVLPCIALAFTLLSASPGAMASLGSSESGIESDRAALNGIASVTPSLAARQGGPYVVHEMKVGSTLVRQFYAPSTGKVFAIAWNGVSQPDLRQLLGEYADEFFEAVRKSPPGPGRHLRAVRGARVVVERWGHVRSLRGRAFDPALFPPGANIDDIH